MYRQDDPTGVATRPPSTAPGSPSYFTDGNPVTNQQSTLVRAEWLNAIGDEGMNLVTGLGQTPSKTTFTQILAAVLFAASGVLSNLVDTSAVANAMVATAQVTAGDLVQTTVPVLPAYKPGIMVTVTPAVTNTSATVTFSVNGIGPLPVLRSDGSQPQPGDLSAGHPQRLYCNGTQWLLVAPTASQLAAASTLNYATDTSTTAGTITATLTPAVTAYTIGSTYRVLPANANAGPVTASFNGMPPIAVTRPDGTACVPNDVRVGKAFDIVIRASGASQVMQMLSWPNSGDGPKNAIAGAAHTYASSDAQNATWRSNSGSPMVDLLAGATAGALPAGWTGTIINADATALLSIQVGAGSTLSGPSIYNGAIVLGPGEKLNVSCDGTNYQAFSLAIRAKLSTATTIFVATNGSDTGNVGIASSSPFATLAGAYAWAKASLDLGGNPLTISLAAGTYGAVVTFLTGSLTGQVSPVIITGPTTGTASINAISVGNGAALAGGQVELQNLTVTDSVGAVGSLIAQTGSSQIYIGAGVTFGTSNGSHMIAFEGGQIIILSPYTVSGNASGSHINAGVGGDIFYRSFTAAVTIAAGGITVGTWASASIGGIISFDSASVSYSGGAVTGTRYSATAGGIINTNGGGANYFPGSTAGSSTGGTYQ
jgi:hypothetical protein